MKKLISICIVLLTLMSCGSSKKILYFQDAPIRVPQESQTPVDITIQPKDKISIIVSSRDPQLALMFNLPRVNYRLGNTSSTSNSNGEVMGYTVDSAGNIDFPFLGFLNVKGQTREQVEQFIKRKLIEEDQIKDPVVTVEFMNLRFSVLGEVKSPGEYFIDRDIMTLTDGISMAGDLTIYGKRDGVYVYRNENGSRIPYQIDLRTTKSFNSPVFYLKQGDIVYVEPNKVRAGQSTVNDNNIKSVSLWISVASFLTTVGVLIFK